MVVKELKEWYGWGRESDVKKWYKDEVGYKRFYKIYVIKVWIFF